MEHNTYREVGKPVRKKDAMQLLLGKPVYMDDITQGPALVVKLLRSPHAYLGGRAEDPLYHRGPDLSGAFAL